MEQRLPRLTVLSQHDHDLRVGELSFRDGKRELAHALLHVGVLIAAHFLHFLLSGRLRHFKHQRRLPEAQVLCRHVAVQENVDS